VHFVSKAYFEKKKLDNSTNSSGESKRKGVFLVYNTVVVEFLTDSFRWMIVGMFSEVFSAVVLRDAVWVREGSGVALCYRKVGSGHGELRFFGGEVSLHDR
jgi:hypothetical protein